MNQLNFVPFIKSPARTFAFFMIVADYYTMEQEELMNQVIKGVGSHGFGNAMEALGWTRDKFQDGFDLINNMQNLDLIKLIYSNFNQNKIVIEFTLLGKAKYNSLV